MTDLGDFNVEQYVFECKKVNFVPNEECSVTRGFIGLEIFAIVQSNVLNLPFLTSY